MALKKLVTIKRVGRFSNSTAAGDTELKRYNLIYAENGRGKTTLCAILRSLQSGDASLVLGRATLGTTDLPEINILLDAGTVGFAAGAWTRTIPQLAIFDGSFVTENVFAGDCVDTEHKRNLYRIIIGAQGVDLAREVDGLDARIRAANAELREAKATVQRFVPQGGTVEAFLPLLAEVDVDSKIQAKERELAAANQTDAIHQQEGLSAVALPALPTDLAALLAKTIEGVQADTEARITQHINAHGFGERGQGWISEGLDYVRNGNCPFCAQSVAGLPLIEAYRTYFGNAYKALKGEITTNANAIRSAYGDRELAALSRSVEQNRLRCEWWTRYCPVRLPALDIGAAEEALRRLREAALTLLERKARGPLEPITVDEHFEGARAVAEAVSQSIGAYNGAVSTVNATIAAKKAAAAVANVQVITAELSTLKAKKARHEPQAAAACRDYEVKTSAKAALEASKEDARRRLDEHTTQVVAQYESAINVFLDRFNAGFQIGSTTHNYRGGTPSSSYQILINRRPVDLGNAETPLDRPSFKNTLSAGDRSALAFAFFLAQLDRDPQKAQMIVVFDDPFSSQDRFRRAATARQIRRCGEQCGQTLVLSHEAVFLKEVWDNFPRDQRQSLELIRVADENTLIRAWNVEEALRDQYRTDIDALQRYYESGEGDPRLIARTVRPVVEAYCRRSHPQDFDGRVTLGAIVARIRELGAEHALHVLVDELDELNVYARRYHHSENANAEHEPIDATELQGYSRRALRIAGCL